MGIPNSSTEQTIAFLEGKNLLLAPVDEIGFAEVIKPLLLNVARLRNRVSFQSLDKYLGVEFGERWYTSLAHDRFGARVVLIAKIDKQQAASRYFFTDTFKLLRIDLTFGSTEIRSTQVPAWEVVEIKVGDEGLTNVAPGCPNFDRDLSAMFTVILENIREGEDTDPVKIVQETIHGSLRSMINERKSAIKYIEEVDEFIVYKINRRSMVTFLEQP